MENIQTFMYTDILFRWLHIKYNIKIHKWTSVNGQKKKTTMMLIKWQLHHKLNKHFTVEQKRCIVLQLPVTW